MPLTITEYRTLKPEIHKCICGSSEVLDSASRSSDCWRNYARVECKKCGLNISTTADVNCHGKPSLESVYLQTVGKWNRIMGNMDVVERVGE
jgi:hypothetical protein